MVRKKILENEKFSRPGKSQGNLILVGEKNLENENCSRLEKNELSLAKNRKFQYFPKIVAS